MGAKSAGKRALCWMVMVILAVSAGGLTQGSDSSGRLLQEELDQMLAPLALYPDPLLAQILMAATYPVEIVEADRWVKHNRHLKEAPLRAALEQRSWDLSVKALVPFRQVLAMMSEELGFTQRVADAFLLEPDEVMDSIQHLRAMAYARGTLKNSREQRVILEQQIIRVEPVDPQVIYVPVYNPETVYGSWWSPAYPPCTWYPAGAVTAGEGISFAPGVAVGATWSSGWGYWNWGGHQLNANINRNLDINQSSVNLDRVQTAKWQHDVEHRKGSPYPSRALRGRFAQAAKADPSRRYAFRGFPEGQRGDLRHRLDERTWKGKRSSGGEVRQPLDDGDDPHWLAREGRPGRGSSSAFQDIGRGDDAQRFSDRGRMSRQKVESAHGAVVVPQKVFSSPEEAVQALAAAIKLYDTTELLALFGPGGRPLFFSGDEAADRGERERFTKGYDEINQLEKKDERRVILHVGRGDWPFPVPIVEQRDTWFFNIAEGKEEILNRRIGKNELAAVQVCLAIVDAQRDFAAEDRDGNGVREYAHRLLSDPGRKNGLYWPVAEGEDPSPLGPLVANAGRKGSAGKASAVGREPYHGYFYRLLAAQGKQAPGGARDYLVKGKMIGGFALVAYPAEYGKTGIMTFIVNQEGIVYEKNLGANTVRTARAMKAFDPDKTWKKAE